MRIQDAVGVTSQDVKEIAVALTRLAELEKYVQCYLGHCSGRWGSSWRTEYSQLHVIERCCSQRKQQSEKQTARPGN